MATNSTVAGYLAAAPPPPDYDLALEDVFHDVIIGVTGLTNDLVRPRIQPKPPNIPDAAVSWVAFGVNITDRDWDPYQSHDPAGLGTNSVERTELLEVLVSFYGPQAQQLMGAWCDGMAVTQNRDVLRTFGIKLRGFNSPVNLPALLKESWHRRTDVLGRFSRTVKRTFAVESLDSASGFIDNENYRTPIDVQPPSP